MFRGMDTRRQDTGLDRQIETLLDRINESSSIVDRLMEMPLPSTADADRSPDWDLAVSRRLERRLSDTLRAMLNGEPEQRRA